MDATTFQERLSRVRDAVEGAARRSGRDPGEVEILPVTKGHRPSAVEAVAEAGFGAVAENRVSEAEEKQERLDRRGLSPEELRWHMVGHLQRNKARLAVHLFDAVESVDSLRLARKLQRELEKAGVERLSVLAQVNCSGEEAKYGLDPDRTPESVAAMAGMDRLRVEGLMTMAPYTDDETVLRETFATLRRLRNRCREEVVEFTGEVLSMGMSNDYEIAVEEGSTRLRLGTALFGPRP